MSLGKTLAELRKKSKMTQSELGDKLNISAQAISKWENDTSEPDIATLKKLADIYGVAISNIVDAENKTESTETSYESTQPTRFDVYLTDAGENELTVMQYLRNMLGIGLADAKNAVENLPYLLTSDADSDLASQIENYFSAVGAKVETEPASVLLPPQNIISLTPPVHSDDTTNSMKKRFVVANVTAGIPAIIVMIAVFCISKVFVDVLISIYLGISTYTFIFLLWYPTFTRKLTLPLRILSEVKGFFATIGAVILAVLLLPWIILVGLISPVDYALTIETRIQRMKDDDPNDDIFF